VRVARQLARELDPSGRAAVLLAGSWVRGEARQGSDIDLWVVGRREADVVLERGGRQVSVHYCTAAAERRALRSPARLGGAVPGWRQARILSDPKGVAARLKREAHRFRWSSVRGARDAYVADQLAGWAEEVVKLLRALETDERETASVQRNLLANRMAMLRALEFELLWGTENGLWERTAKLAGPAFRSAQQAALGTDEGSWREGCEGALRLYALSARANLGILRGEKRRIVTAACRRAGYPIEGPGSRQR
jgi:nucleotidyltransferase-like protein